MTATVPDQRMVDPAQSGRIATRLNWLRAEVMGANDGIVSTAGMVVGVAGAAVSNSALLAAGVAAMLAGALWHGCGRVRVGIQPTGLPARRGRDRAGRVGARS